MFNYQVAITNNDNLKFLENYGLVIFLRKLHLDSHDPQLPFKRRSISPIFSRIRSSDSFLHGYINAKDKSVEKHTII